MGIDLKRIDESSKNLAENYECVICKELAD